MQRGRSPVSVADLVAAGLLRPGQRVRFRRDETITGELTDAGAIRIGADEYRSPSTAGRAVAGGTATNGWTAWSVHDGDDWVTLATVRDRMRPDSSG